MKLLFTLVLVCIYSSISLIAQTYEKPFEIGSSNFIYYDMAVKGNQVYLIGSHGPNYNDLSVFQFRNANWEEISNVVFENGINQRLRTQSQKGYDPYNNPKIYIDEDDNLWVTGNRVYHRKDNVWYSYKPPIKTVNFDSLFYYQFHELYFLKNKQPLVSSLITTMGLKYNGFRIGYFEMFTLLNDTLRHTDFEKKVSNVKHSVTVLADESKMTVIGDTIVVYKQNGTIFFVNPDGKIDSTEFPGNRGQKSSNLEIRQILPLEDSKLLILTDVSPNDNKDFPACCAGLFLLENRSKWTVFTELNGLYRNVRNNYYTPRSAISNPNGSCLIAMYPNNPVGFYSQIYILDKNNQVTHIPLDNRLNSARIFPRRNYISGISKEMFSTILQAIRTNDYGLSIPKQEIYKIRLDGLGNLWCLFDDFIMQIPAFIPTSVTEDISVNSTVLVVPNPATNSISLSSIPSSCEKVEIVSVHGQIIQTVTSDYHNIKIQLLPTGVYLLKIHSKSGIQTTTFIKEF